MSIASQDVFLNLQTPLSVIGGGGGGGGVDNVTGVGNLVNIGPTTGNVSLNTVGALANISSLGFAAGGGALTGLSSINGLPYVSSATVPSNLTVSTLTVSSLAGVSSLTAANVSSSSLNVSSMTATSISSSSLLVSSINGVGQPGRYVGVNTPLTSFSTNVNTSGAGATVVFATAGNQPSTIILANREGAVNFNFKVSSIGDGTYISTSVGNFVMSPSDNITLQMNFTQIGGGTYITYAQIPCNSFYSNGVFGATNGLCVLSAPIRATTTDSYLGSIQALYSPTPFNSLAPRPVVNDQSIQIFYQDINVQAI